MLRQIVEKQRLKPTLAFFNACNKGSGAENLVASTVEALAHRGYQVKLHVRTIRTTNDEAQSPLVASLPYLPGELIAERAARALTGLNDFYFRTKHNLMSNDEIRQAQVWHFHNLHGHYLSIPALARLSLHKKIIISPVDEFLGTGYCTYRMGCQRLDSGCGKCPQIDSPYPKISRDATPSLLKIKRAAVKESKFNLLVHTDYLASFYREQFGEQCSITRINYGVNINAFRPKNRLSCAESLGIILSKRFVIGIMHSNITEPRKGLLALLEKLRTAAALVPDGLELLVVGGGSEAAKKFQTENLIVTAIPYLASETALSSAFNLCDVLLYPTKADNLSLTTLNAMSCGVPVISSAIGGQGEAITTGVDGFLCTSENLEEFIERALFLKNNQGNLAVMSNRARERICNQFDFDHYITNLQEFYEKILAKGTYDP